MSSRGEQRAQRFKPVITICSDEMGQYLSASFVSCCYLFAGPHSEPIAEQPLGAVMFLGLDNSLLLANEMDVAEPTKTGQTWDPTVSGEL